MFEAVEGNGPQREPQRKQRDAPAALAEKESDSNPKEAAHENPAGRMLGGAAKQVNAKKKRMIGWREEQPQPGVVRGWTVRKVNSRQKIRKKQMSSFEQATLSNQVTG